MDTTRTYYNSANSHVLATYAGEGDNTQMLLYKPHFEQAGDGPANTAWLPYRREFVIGSYFTTTPFPDNITDYSWHWGHYFDNVVDAVDFWNREVLGSDDGNDLTCIGRYGKDS